MVNKRGWDSKIPTWNAFPTRTAFAKSDEIYKIYIVHK